jgi:putative Ca2+/H+ antiporter (TMEM165/GDT1 family)
MFAQFICQYVPTDVIKKIAAVAFVLMGCLIFFDKI